MNQQFHQQRLGPSAQTKPWTRAMTGFARRMRRRGRSFDWIARALGVPREVCVMRLTRASMLRSPPRLADAFDGEEPVPLGGVRDILGEGVCHWICGDLDDPDWRMCGHRVAGGSSWCAHHLKRVCRR